MLESIICLSLAIISLLIFYFIFLFILTRYWYEWCEEEARHYYNYTQDRIAMKAFLYAVIWPISVPVWIICFIIYIIIICLVILTDYIYKIAKKD